MKHVSVVRPRNQPPPRRATPKSRPVRKTSLPGCIRVEERDRRLCDHEWDVSLEPVIQSLALVRRCVLAWAHVDEDGVAVDLDRKAAELVGELVERAARAQVETGVMPVTRQDPVADGASVEREAHVRAAVVDCMDLVAVGEQADGVGVEMYDETPPRAHVGEGRGTHELARRRIYGGHSGPGSPRKSAPACSGGAP